MFGISGSVFEMSITIKNYTIRYDDLGITI